jgi:hypothetical protein
MDKLSRSANIVIGVGKLCQARGLAEEDLPDGLRTILKSLHRYVWPTLVVFRYLTSNK